MKTNKKPLTVERLQDIHMTFAVYNFIFTLKKSFHLRSFFALRKALTHSLNELLKFCLNQLDKKLLLVFAIESG